MFEKINKIDNSREADGPRERHYTIELSDREHRERLEAKLVYVPPPPVEDMSPALKEKFNKARELTKDTKVINVDGGSGAKPLDIDDVWKVKKLKEGKKNEREARKTPKKRTKKNNSKPNTAAVARV